MVGRNQEDACIDLLFLEECDWKSVFFIEDNWEMIDCGGLDWWKNGGNGFLVNVCASISIMCKGLRGAIESADFIMCLFAFRV